MEIGGSNPPWVTKTCSEPPHGAARSFCSSLRVLVPTLERMTSEPDPKQEYREAYDAWQKQLAGVHDLLLDGNRIPPEQIKGLLNREARAKERYDAARRRLLGIDG